MYRLHYSPNCLLFVALGMSDNSQTDDNVATLFPITQSVLPRVPSLFPAFSAASTGTIE